MAAGSAQSSKSRARRKRRHLGRPRDQVQTVRLYPVVPAEQVGDHTGRGEAQSARAAAACPLKGAKTRFRWREVAALQERASFGTLHDRPVTRRERFRPVAGARLARGLPALSGFSALATRMMQRQMEKLSGGYFPRAVFFFGFGLPVLPGAASFFGRFGDTCSLPWLAVLRCLRVQIRPEAPRRPAGRSAPKYRSASPPCQSTEPSRPRPETAIVNGCCNRARPAKVARRCVPASLSRATAASRLSQQTTCQEKGSASTDQATPS